MSDRCETCGDTKTLAYGCSECEGNGWVPDPEDGGTMMCPDCDDQECPDCDELERN